MHVFIGSPVFVQWFDYMTKARDNNKDRLSNIEEAAIILWCNLRDYDLNQFINSPTTCHLEKHQRRKLLRIILKLMLKLENSNGDAMLTMATI